MIFFTKRRLKIELVSRPELWVAYHLLVVHHHPKVFPHDGDPHQTHKGMDPLSQSALKHISQSVKSFASVYTLLC